MTDQLFHSVRFFENLVLSIFHRSKFFMKKVFVFCLKNNFVAKKRREYPTSRQGLGGGGNRTQALGL